MEGRTYYLAGKKCVDVSTCKYAGVPDDYCAF